MGISIYYSGSLRSPELIDSIIIEASDISENMHWEITELPSTPDIPVRGILIQPENCDPLWLTFHSNGDLSSPILYSFLLETGDIIEIEKGKQVLVTYTQHAGPETHMKVIKFFRYLSEKYFSRFELHDDSRFWYTGNEDLCRKRFGKGERILDMLNLAHSGMNARSGKRIGNKSMRKLLKKRS